MKKSNALLISAFFFGATVHAIELNISSNTAALISYSVSPPALFKVQQSSDLEVWTDITEVMWSSSTNAMHYVENISESSNQFYRVISYTNPVVCVTNEPGDGIQYKLTSYSGGTDEWLLRSTVGKIDTDNNGVFDRMIVDEVASGPSNSVLYLKADAITTQSNRMAYVEMFVDGMETNINISYVSQNTNSWGSITNNETLSSITNSVFSVLPHLIQSTNEKVYAYFPKNSVAHTDDMIVSGSLNIIDPDPVAGVEDEEWIDIIREYNRTTFSSHSRGFSAEWDKEENVSSYTIEITTKYRGFLRLDEAFKKESHSLSGDSTSYTGILKKGSYYVSIYKHKTVGFYPYTLKRKICIGGATVKVPDLEDIPPVISAEPTSLSALTTEGSTASSVSSTISNTGGQSLQYQVSVMGGSSMEMSVHGGMGALENGESSTVAISFPDSATLPVGNYSGQVLVADPNPEVDPVYIGVSLKVTPPPNLLVNGSFEDGPDPSPRTWIKFGTGSSAMNGWVVSKGNVDLVNEWTAAEGTLSVDLNGDMAGGVRQTITTEPGASYRITFSLCGNPGGPALETLRVLAAGSSQTYTFDTTGHTRANPGWRTEIFEFTAIDNQEDITFESIGANDPGGPSIDNIRINRIY